MRSLVLAILCLQPALSYAASLSDDDEPFFLDDEEGTPPARLDGPDDIERAADESREGGLDEFIDEGDRVNLFGDEPTGPVGADTAELFRKTEGRVKGMDSDEEMQVWEAYLAKYPETSFRTRIERRLEALTDSLYASRISGGEGVVDADRDKLAFSMPLMLENINPRTRAQFGFEYGLPEYMNLVGDYEHGLSREMSVHAGIRRRYTGFNLETGARYALVKSARTHTLVTLLGDLRFNFDPAFVGFRPQIAVGKRFGDKLDLMAIGGVELNLRSPFDFRVVGGANATYLTSDTVGLFVEGNLHMKNLGWDGGAFEFNTFGLGMKFFPNQKSERPEALEINFGAQVPFTWRYWRYHYGSIAVSVNYLF